MSLASRWSKALRFTAVLGFHSPRKRRRMTARYLEAHDPKENMKAAESNAPRKAAGPMAGRQADLPADLHRPEDVVGVGPHGRRFRGLRSPRRRCYAIENESSAWCHIL